MTCPTPGHTTSSLGDTGAYERLRKIGAGGMGEVWLARRALGNGIEKTVALKFLPSHVAEDARARRDFIREVQLCMHLSHAAIVQVFDVCEVEGRLCMVMEWVDGVDLAQLMRARAREGRALPVEVVTHIIIELLRALDYAHRLQHDGRALCIVHRDVSPHNVLVSVSGDVKLTDFGVARPVHEETSGLHVRGKLRYMAPEQFSGAAGRNTDLYGLGATMLYLLSGGIHPNQFPQSRLKIDFEGRVVASEDVLDVLGGKFPPPRCRYRF